MFMGAHYYSEEELEKFSFKKIGNNVKIKKNVVISNTENLSIGDNVRIDDFSVIINSQEECFIGSYVHLASHCVILGRAGFTMSDFSGLSPHVTLVSLSDDYTGLKLTNPTVDIRWTGGKSGRIILGRHVIIGTGSVILPDVHIGEGSSVGAMSVVRKSLEGWGVYAGAPIKRIADRKKDILDLEKKFISNS
jgi:galactoside O-acetyltransferase